MRKTLHALLIIILLSFITVSLNAQWVQTNGPGVGSIHKIVYLNNKIYVAAYNGGIYASSNNGNNWMLMNNGIGNNLMYSLYAYNNVLYAGTAHNGTLHGTAYLYKSTNFGQTWTIFSTLQDNFYYEIIVDSDYVFCATGSGVLRTTMNNINWTNVFSGGIMSIARNSSVVYAGERWNGTYISTNYGNNWVITGLPTYLTSWSFLINDNYVFAGTNDGVFRSSDNGNSWQNKLLRYNTVYEMVICENNIFTGIVNDGIFFSSNNGDNWIIVNQGLTSYSVYALCVSDSILYAGIGNNVWKRNIHEMTVSIKSYSELINKYELSQNYPNPFNPTTNIKYDLPKNNFVSVKIFDMLGREIETLVNEKQSAGTYKVQWNASQYPSGVYFYKLETEGFTETKKMILLK